MLALTLNDWATIAALALALSIVIPKAYRVIRKDWKR